MWRFFWPTKFNPEPGVLTHLGRVLHWVAVMAAALVIVVTLPITWFYLNHPVYEGSPGVYASLRHLALALPAAAVIVLLGRGLRYILSGE